MVFFSLLLIHYHKIWGIIGVLIEGSGSAGFISLFLYDNHKTLNSTLHLQGVCTLSHLVSHQPYQFSRANIILIL